MLDIEITDDDINTIEEELSLEFDEKRRAVLKDNTSIDVQACPGSGKTTLEVMMYRLFQEGKNDLLMFAGSITMKGFRERYRSWRLCSISYKCCQR